MEPLDADTLEAATARVAALPENEKSGALRLLFGTPAQSLSTALRKGVIGHHGFSSKNTHLPAFAEQAVLNAIAASGRDLPWTGLGELPIFSPYSPTNDEGHCTMRPVPRGVKVCQHRIGAVVGCVLRLARPIAAQTLPRARMAANSRVSNPESPYNPHALPSLCSICERSVRLWERGELATFDFASLSEKESWGQRLQASHLLILPSYPSNIAGQRLGGAASELRYVRFERPSLNYTRTTACLTTLAHQFTGQMAELDDQALNLRNYLVKTHEERCAADNSRYADAVAITLADCFHDPPCMAWKINWPAVPTAVLP
jgi:hypothetical protein